MGEADFYLVAIGASIEDYMEFKKRLDDLVALNEDFHKIRDRGEIPPVERWNKLKSMHPLACELLNGDVEDERLKDDRHLNDLVDVIPDLTSEYVLEYEAGVVTLYDHVWHFTSWDGIAAWLENRGCVAEWISSEHVDLHLHLAWKMRALKSEDIIDKLYKLLSEGKVDEARRLLLTLKI